jgi:hypothetical protein
LGDALPVAVALLGEGGEIELLLQIRQKKEANCAGRSEYENNRGRGRGQGVFTPFFGRKVRFVLKDISLLEDVEDHDKWKVTMKSMS